MKWKGLILAVIGASLLTGMARKAPIVGPPEPKGADPATVFAVFEGRIPCADCEKIKVRLYLFKDPATGAPASYFLREIKKGTVYHTQGKWDILRGAKSDPNATIYRLDPDQPEKSVGYMRVGDVALMLDGDLKPRVGFGGFSFTLNLAK